MTISPEAYWQQRDSKYRGEWTEEIQKNGAKTIAAVNKLLAYAAKDGIERNEVSSGWRPKGINDATANAAKVSNHLLALACDIKDTDRELAQWCVYNLNKLDECGLWMEDPRYSPTWLHLQTSANGVITWATTEADDTGTFAFTTRVVDNGSPSLATTNTFTVTVNELNIAPVLTLPANQTISELNFYTNTATATDADLPANPLAFALVSGPTNLTVSPAGAITWTPSEAQGPGTYIVQIKVTDSNPPAVNATSLSVTSSFTFTVSEVNVAPVLAVPGDQTIHAGYSLSRTATATDADVPANTLTFERVSGPTGLTVSGAGLITWPTAEADAGTTNSVSVRVFDNGSPSLSATSSFNVVVVSRPLLLTPAVSGANLNLTWTAIPATSYRLEFNTNLSVSNWTGLAGDVTAGGSTASKLDPLTTSNRNYRVRVLP